jgi:hypothetical protein
MVGISPFPVVLLALALIIVPTEASASPHAESALRHSRKSHQEATCRPASPELSTYSSGLNRARLQPAFDAVTLTRQRDELRVAWTLSSRLKSPAKAAEYGSTIFSVVIWKKSAANKSGGLLPSDAITALQVLGTHGSTREIKWVASVGGLGSTKDIKEPVAGGGESIMAYFPFSALKGALPRSFEWTAEVLRTQTGGVALEGCPTPENGYGHGGLGIDLQWTKADLQSFP